MKKLMASIALVMGFQAHAVSPEMGAIVNASVQSVQMDLDWTVGDTADYNISMGFISGTMKSFIREKVDAGYWVEQNMDLGFAGKQKVEILFDRVDGRPLEILVNGEKQNVPDGSNQEVEEVRNDNISVPAGSFDCLYVRVRDTKENKTSEVWLNGEIVPMGGMIKTIAPSQFGNVTVELTAYNKL